MNAPLTRTEEGIPILRVDVVEPGARNRRGDERCELGRHIEFFTDKLESYRFTEWQPVVFDALVLTAAVEFCDRRRKRPALGWGRIMHVRLPVHDPDHWNNPLVKNALQEAVGFLTGDTWYFSFTGRKQAVPPPPQSRFHLPDGTRSITPFSDGLDSRAVYSIMERELGDRLIRVRVGSKDSDIPKSGRRKQPFASLPYKVRPVDCRFPETSARSRGFKFALVSALAAYLVGTSDIIVPESGQGALGPSLVPVGHAYEDYRNHPFFTERMQRFVKALLGHDVLYRFPRLWFTKGETLRAYIELRGEDAAWKSTWSCWQQSRQVSVGGAKRQCGICAACMLRRLSIHAADAAEPADRYVWENLSASSFEGGAATGFAKFTNALGQYAVAGALHLDHLADLVSSPSHQPMLRRQSILLGRTLGISPFDADQRLKRLLQQHQSEWTSFMSSIGPNTFLAPWIRARS